MPIKKQTDGTLVIEESDSAFGKMFDGLINAVFPSDDVEGTTNSENMLALIPKVGGAWIGAVNFVHYKYKKLNVPGVDKVPSIKIGPVHLT